MTNKPFALTALLFLLATAASFRTAAQNDKKETSVTAEDLAKLRAAVEADPNSVEAHEAYIKATGFTKWGAAEDPAFVKQYEEWMKKFPASAAVSYALGHAYAGKESPKAKPYLLKAVEIDPAFDKAYFDLWIDAERWGDFDLSREYLAKAKKAAPKNADYAFYYAGTFKNTDFKKYKKLSLKVAKNFPNTERGAQALYWLANRTQEPAAKVKYYEQQKRDFPADKFNWTASGMSEYHSLLLKTSPEKALALAESMSAMNQKDSREKKTWEANVVTTKNIIEAKALLAEEKGPEAAVLMEKVAVPRYGSAKEYILLLKAKALDAAGKSQDAYKNLLLSYVKEPTASLWQELMQYGSKLGKAEAAVAGEVGYVRDTAAKQAPDFTLENYYTKANTSLSDYKGKIVLVTYWFPGCGPCRGEFPHFENVVRKFKNRDDFVYLGINIVAEQDDYVLPFMKASRYSFIPLKDNDKWQKGPMDNRNAAPVNFLIDQNGKIIFSNFRTDESNEQSLEMMITSLLDRKKSA